MTKNPKILVEIENSWIQGYYTDDGKSFEFFDIYFGDNLTSISLPKESFSKIVDLFRKIILNDKLQI